MEKRFGIKDIIVIVLLLLVAVLIVLKMVQDDRQFAMVVQLQNQIRQQSRDITDIARNGGGGRSTSTAIAAAPKGDPFAVLKEAESKPDFSRGDWLIENFGVKFQRLTPLGTVGDLYTTYVHSRVTEPLIYRDPQTFKYLPLLAEDWEVIDKSDEYYAFAKPLIEKGIKPDVVAKDPKAPIAIEIKFKLRKNVTFSDGHPFTADDVVFSYKWIMNKKVEAPRQRSYYERVRDVVKINDHEVAFLFTEPYFESLDLAGSLGIYPKHFYEAIGPEKFNQTPGLLMGTGPFMLASPDTWTPGKKVELLRNEKYWGVRATFDRIVYNEVEGENAEAGLLKNGEVDRLACPPELYDQLRRDPEVMKRVNNHEVSSPDSGYTFVGWNQIRGGKPTPFADKRVRQAMTLLTDRERMAKEIYQGYAVPAHGVFSGLSDQADPSVSAHPYDPNRAKALLKDVGFDDRNGDGVIESSQGQPLRFKLMYSAKSDISRKITLFLKDGYAKAGIIAEPDATDWTIMMKRVDSRDFDAITMGWSASVESDLFQTFHSSQIADAGDNFCSYNSPQLDKLIDQARTTVNLEKRLPLWRQCDKIIHDEQPYTFLLERKSLLFIDKRISNVGRSKLGLNYAQRYEMPVPWYVPKAQQKYPR